ncbi:acyl carrier protein [Streptomyces olivaceus]|uniref:acyl carrier protein n=1 Tax=Streptomyces olivaceus TaxID=47716 RepID=UPI001884E7D0|nr:acyl carrier protein [Streptomyces olivaceus]
MEDSGIRSWQIKISDVWAELLDLDEVPVDTHFYDVGGNSLRFVILLAQLNQLIGQDLDPAELFRRSTVRAQAELLVDTLGTSARRGHGV